jgi:hypothetical protein
MLKEIILSLLKWDLGLLALGSKPLILEFLALHEKWCRENCLLSYPLF